MKVQLKLFQSEDWYYEEELRENLEMFSQQKARYPFESRIEAFRQLNSYLDKIKAEMGNEGLWERKQYSGSTSEGLKINDELEFDVMSIVIGQNIKIINVKGYPGYAHLKIKGGNNRNEENALQRFMDSNYNFLSPGKFLSEYSTQLKTAVEELNEHEHEIEINIKRNGPSICLIFEYSNGVRWFKVDIVPTIEIEKNGQVYQYVAKPVSNTGKSDLLSNSWRRSTSSEEKELIKNIDGNNECRKKCFRTVKAICKGESTLRALSSFHLKMILFHAIDQYPSMSWEPDDFCERVFQFLGFIEQYLEAETLPHYFNRAMNIFRTSHFSDKHIESMFDRIRNLRTEEEKFMKVIST